MSALGTSLIGLDLGTTHCKAGLFAENGTVLRSASRPTPTRRAQDGSFYYDPEELWQTTLALLEETLAAPLPSAGPPVVVGIASMAETGLLIDRASGEARTPLLPWFDRRAGVQAERLSQAADEARFGRSGLRPSFKLSLARLMWLAEHQPDLIPDGLWLSTADYVAWRLCGQAGTDFSLAGRTYAFDIGLKAWDEDWLADWGLPADLFPTAHPSGEPLGGVTAAEAMRLGLPAGTPVAVSGHDHVNASLAVGLLLGGLRPGQVLDSMGTAEALLGVLPPRPALDPGQPLLGAAEYGSGLSYGVHAGRERYYWIGGLSASGGSLEWLRSLLGEQALTYDQVETLLAGRTSGPSGILYFPYLSGSGSPHTDSNARAAFVGLAAQHGRGDLLQAALEGTAYEVEWMRRSAQTATGAPIERLVAVGGGTRNHFWLQIKADVCGFPIDVPEIEEAALLGAALAAGIEAGVYAGEADAVARLKRPAVQVVTPDPKRHAAYQRLFEDGYLPLQQPLRETYRRLSE